VSRIAIISDIHSNLPAFEAVLARIADQGCQEIWCLGDVVGYGAQAAECLALTRDRATHCVQGNHDHAVHDPDKMGNFNRHAAAAVLHNRDCLEEEDLQWLGDLPTRIDLEGGTILCHGTPEDRDHYLLLPEDMMRLTANLQITSGGGCCFFGHTHIQLVWTGEGVEPVKGPGEFSLREGRRWLCNPGSVGQPRDRDVRAAFAILDTDAGRVIQERVEYDIEAAQKSILAAGLPERLATRLGRGA
jgi:diadenosine tetraphosphatase ApaH/serine/threonine PP2A family protein phosphatase